MLLVPVHELGERFGELFAHSLERPLGRQGIGIGQVKIRVFPHQQPQWDLDQVEIIFFRGCGQALRQCCRMVEQEVFGDAVGAGALQERRPAGAQARSDDHDPLELRFGHREV